MDQNFWSTLCATGPLRFIVLTFFIFARLSSCVSLPWPHPVPARAGHVSTAGDGPPGPTGKRDDGPPRVYTRAELLSIRPARLSAELAGTLRTLDIGFRLPRKRNKRKHTTKKMKVAVFNAQSARTIASDIHELIVDNKLDILLLTETWLKPEGDENTISTMTPTGYVCRSFPRGARGYGGIAFVLRSNIEATFTPLDFTTFECVEMKTKHGNATITCVYRPPYSTKNKITDSAFVNEIPALLERYATMTSDITIFGDVNIHFNKPENCQVKTSLYGFGQLYETVSECPNASSWKHN